MIFVSSLLSAFSRGLVSFAFVCIHSVALLLLVVIVTNFSMADQSLLHGFSLSSTRCGQRGAQSYQMLETDVTV